MAVLTRVIRTLLILTSAFNSSTALVARRFHENSESRAHVHRDFGNSTEFYDIVSLENYYRNYLHGPQNDRFMYFNHDEIAAYVGPKPKMEHIISNNQEEIFQPFRGWAMFDKRTGRFCELDAIYDFGELALFSCPEPGLYRAYAIQYILRAKTDGTKIALSNNEVIEAWTTRKQKDQFNLLTGDDNTGGSVFTHISRPRPGETRGSNPIERMDAILFWEGPRPETTGQVANIPSVVVSDPVVIRNSQFCYYWMYHLTEVAKVGYIDDEVNPIDSRSEDNSHMEGTAYILYELNIWIAEPSAVGYWETSNDEPNKIMVSEYSKVITNRFFTTGLFPCIRKAHSVIEIVEEIKYVRSTDQSSTLVGTPHWRAILKVHTDRLISTLSDVTFIIASRQNTGSFNCFVGDTGVYINLRNFEFVPIRILDQHSVNLLISNVDPAVKADVKFEVDRVYGHGVHHIGYKGPKRFQPASTRSDMVIVINACVAQEFAFSVAGSLYIAEGLLQKGHNQVTKVALPYFPDSRRIVQDITVPPPNIQDYLRIYDIAFTPTHVAFLMSEGYVILHSSSASQKGLADIKETMKYRPDVFVKRRWCARTATPKLSGMILPIYGTRGTIIILQVYPMEGNVRVWSPPPSTSCLVEGHGFVKKFRSQQLVINETDIHYQEYSAVRRTNQRTGLVEPPPPYRPPPPSPPKRNLLLEKTFLLDSTGRWIGDKDDPHFPPQVVDPASHSIESNLENLNQAVIYVVEESGDGAEQDGLLRILKGNGLTPTGSGSGNDDQSLVSVEFTAEEKEFVFALVFNALEIPRGFAESSASTSLQNIPFQMVVSTLTIVNFPYRVRLRKQSNVKDKNFTDEKLDTVAPFPGTILIRSKPYKVDVEKSLDPIENQENTRSLSGNSKIDFTPQIYTLGTSVPSYVINLGDVLIYSSIENRYARPLHFYTWDVVDKQSRSASHFQEPEPLTFENSTTKFEKSTLYDAVVTEQGIVSVLWRKRNRHLIMDDPLCLVTDDVDQQTVAIGSAIVLEGLREVKPFFRNDNIFQRATPDGEIIYGIYDVKPLSSFQSCKEPYNDTLDNEMACIDQPIVNSTTKLPIQICTSDLAGYDIPCRDPSYIEYCTGPVDRNGSFADKIHACLRKNRDCAQYVHRYPDEYNVTRPRVYDDKAMCDGESEGLINCLPKHAPREEIRSIHLLGTSFQSYLQGSLQDVKTIHPETMLWDDKESRQEPDICPFASFDIYHKELDFAEVGYQTRITGEISYFGTGIPTEADILVEFEQNIGIIVAVSSSVEEERHLTTIRKTIDIKFEMTDYILQQLLDFNPAEKHHIRKNDFTYDDIRSREPFSVFSITLRPSIVNTRCKNSDFFKTVQFNVGCNAFSSMRLISEATPLKRINWTEFEDDAGLKWYRHQATNNLTIPKRHIYYQQVKNNVFQCDTEYCRIPYFHLFNNDIFTISYRDFFQPHFEQFLTISSRAVTGNVVLYDMLGSKEFNWTLNKLYAGCRNTEHFWYDKVLHGTKDILNETFEHENLYLYYKDCFSKDEKQGEQEQSQNLYVSPFYFFNKTNDNSIKFLRKRNQIFIFRAVALNTYYNRFTYCKFLDTFFMVRVTGIPIPRQGLELWLYISIFLSVLIALIISYVFFSKFYRGISTAL